MTEFRLTLVDGGTQKTMRDHTQWCQDRYGQSGVLRYHQAVIKAAQRKRGAGSLGNIKELARYDDKHGCIEILIRNGVILDSVEAVNRSNEHDRLSGMPGTQTPDIQ